MPTRSIPAESASANQPRPCSPRPGRLAADWLGAEPDAFDVWLRRGLQADFDAVARQPVPAELLALIEEDSARRERAAGC
jgi:hypothetical protein